MFWEACSRAVANALTLLKRLRGSFFSAVSTTCSTWEAMGGTFSCNGGGEAARCCATISVIDP